MANEENVSDVPDVPDDPPYTAAPSDTSDNETISKFLSLGIKPGDMDFFLNQGEKYFLKEKLLSLRLGITIENAKIALANLKSSNQRNLTQDDISRIETCLIDYPDIGSVEDIALFCVIPQDLVATYLDSKPISDIQKTNIRDLFNNGKSVCEIVNELQILSKAKVEDYISSTFLTFNGDEGQGILSLIRKQNKFGTFSGLKIRELVKCRNVELQDQLCFVLPQNEQNEYLELKKYFDKFDESKNFFEIDTDLSIADILIIKQSNLDTEQLSIKLNKVETVLKMHLQQYSPHKAEKEYCVYLQGNQIKELLSSFGASIKTFHHYRTILSNIAKQKI